MNTERYQRIAADLAQVCETGDAEATERLGRLFGGALNATHLRTEVLRRLAGMPGRIQGAESVSLQDAQWIVARLYGFASWDSFAGSVSQAPARPAAPVHGLSAGPPFFRFDSKSNSIEIRPPFDPADWQTIFEMMRDHGITHLRAGAPMADAVLERLSRLDFLTALDIEGARQVTDAGLQHLARMPQLERLNLTGCNISDTGLAVLRGLHELREFSLYHHHGVSDVGLANLQNCERLECVNLLGANAGDGVLRALAGKAKLRRFLSGNGVTDAGLPLLQEFPVFKTWQGENVPEISLMDFHAEPNYLLLRGPISDAGMKALEGLDGLYALNLDDARLSITVDGIRPLASLPNLRWLGFDATDETMGAIGDLPRLHMLMCQDTQAGDRGFQALSRSRTLQYLWGRRCHNLTGAGFKAMAKMPSLRGLSVSCKNVADEALSLLPEFPSLVEFMPMDFTDASFRHVGRCKQLRAVWCMYCRETGDAATSHLTGLGDLKTYYAGKTNITDRSMEMLGGMPSLEQLTFWDCAGVTNAGVTALSSLPRLQELSLESMPGVTRECLGSFPSHVRVSFDP